MSDNLHAGGELSRQAGLVRTLGSPFVAAVLQAGDRHLDRAPRTSALIRSWPGDPAAAALGMRFNAALHALARRGRPSTLSTLFAREHEDFDGAIGTAMATEDAFIANWMRDPPQTNEVCRAAAIIAALMVAHERYGLPFELLELGSSAGLNLNLARYAYDFRGVMAGALESTVRIRPEWRGPLPPISPIDVASARGVDLHPLDASEEATRGRLLSFVFADQPERAERLNRALQLARRHPPQIDRGEAVAWLCDRLAEEQPADQCRVVVHTMVMQYFGAEQRRAADSAIAAAGDHATDNRPLARISFEWTPARTEVQLRLQTWPDGEETLLALCHPYGAWIDWKACE